MLTVSIITPERALPPYQASHVTFTAVDGQVGVRTGMAPMVAQLKVGFAMIRDLAGKEINVALKGGVAQVLNDQVRLFVEAAVDFKSIDLELIQKKLDQLGSSNATDQATIKRNEAEAQWFLMQQSIALGRSGESGARKVG
jgi:F-type H+-transporting ATPase subunit epsilon